ncbi:hypothetical protein BLFGPEAP_01138 [Candidatus Methanoperedenaceae archaeon GB50]|nr:hypothetical protein BLFGPEAP_01138 [Candidatus Methanoperedenaceae archaeon GB50]
MKLAAATGPLIVKIREDKLVEHGYLCSPKIKIFNVQSPTLPPYMSYPMAYEQGIIRNATRNLLIEDLAKKLVAEGRTVLILVEAIEHGNRLAELLNAPFLSGKETRKIRKKTISSLSKKEIDMLITTKIFDEGIDVPAISAVIMAAGGKSYVRCIQRIGRSMRTNESKKNPVIIDFLDNCHPHLKRHSLKRIKLYREKNYPISFLENQIPL